MKKFTHTRWKSNQSKEPTPRFYPGLEKDLVNTVWHPDWSKVKWRKERMPDGTYRDMPDPKDKLSKKFREPVRYNYEVDINGEVIPEIYALPTSSTVRGTSGSVRTQYSPALSRPTLPASRIETIPQIKYKKRGEKRDANDSKKTPVPQGQNEARRC